MEVLLNKQPFYWLNQESRDFLTKGYLLPGQTPEERIRFIANRAEEHLSIPGYADKFYNYMSRGWFSLSSPVWSNYGLERGMPVSCFGGYVPDSTEGILYTHAEQGMLSKLGGGTSLYFGDVRHRGAPITNNGESNGVVPFIRMMDTMTDVISQGSTRRGYMAVYLPIDHPDINEFLEIGSDGNDIQGIMTGVNVSDAWLKSMTAGDSDKRALWAKVLRKRSEHGYPYIFFTDNVNNAKPECYRDSPILASNLCSEIALPSSETETFTCVLSSINLLHYDEWKDTDAVEVLTMFLDTVVQELINSVATGKYSKFMDRVLNFAKNHRAIGLGVLGWHSYLQSRLIPFESQQAAKLNLEVFKLIRTKAEAASIELGSKLGTVFGTNRRNTTLMAVAPTKSSSFILGQVSQGIEPIMSNYFVNNTAKAVSVYRNPYLEQLLTSKGINTPEVWQSILEADGSVQHLADLTDNERLTFRTFAEINPEAIIDQAAVRQEFIDQAQSINLMISPTMAVRDVNALYLRAWSLGVKSLYYQFSLSAAQVKSRELNKSNECLSCHA